MQDGFSFIFEKAKLRICYDKLKLSLEYHKTHANLRGKIWAQKFCTVHMISDSHGSESESNVKSELSTICIVLYIPGKEKWNDPESTHLTYIWKFSYGAAASRSLCFGLPRGNNSPAQNCRRSVRGRQSSSSLQGVELDHLHSAGCRTVLLCQLLQSR